MDIKRRNERNRIHVLIKDINVNIDRAKASIKRSQFNSEYFLKQKQYVEDKKKLLEETEERLQQLNRGELDDELTLQTKNDMDEVLRKQSETKRRKVEKAKYKAEKKQMSQEYWNKQVKDMRQQRYNTKDMNRKLQHFYRNCDSIPQYMLRNLSKMPSNKGYIWKGIQCYGELPPDPKARSTVLFNKPQRDVLHIHEWNYNEYKVYEKIGKDRKKLIHQNYRKNARKIRELTRSAF
jgi:hypothetical protein